jgi:hypothetical protein
VTTVTDPTTGNKALVTECRSCRAPVYWGFTKNGKRCPFDVVKGQPTETSHFATCPDAKTWSKKGA